MEIDVIQVLKFIRLVKTFLSFGIKKFQLQMKNYYTYEIPFLPQQLQVNTYWFTKLVIPQDGCHGIAFLIAMNCYHHRQGNGL
jgi:hypothetical protein